MNTRRVRLQAICVYLELAVVLLAIVVVVGIYHHNEWGLPVKARWQIVFTAFCAFLLSNAISRTRKKMH